MGIENAVDTVGGTHPHGSDSTHIVESEVLQMSESDTDASHCSLCCHGHTVSGVGQLSVLNCVVPNQQFALYQPYILNFSQAPPTPPPNA